MGPVQVGVRSKAQVHHHRDGPGVLPSLRRSLKDRSGLTQSPEEGGWEVPAARDDPVREPLPAGDEADRFSHYYNGHRNNGHRTHAGLEGRLPEPSVAGSMSPIGL